MWNFAAGPRHTGPARPYTQHTGGITHVVWHYTWSSLDWDAARIDVEHTRRGWNGIGYHYVVLPDGTLEFGRPDWAAGAHVRSGNDRKLGLVFIGGRRRGDNVNGWDTRTDAQRATLDRVTESILKVHPTAAVVGHRDLVATQCPGFDVAAYWAARSGRVPVVVPVAVLPAITNPPLASWWTRLARKVSSRA